MSAQNIYAEVGKRYSAAAAGVEAQYASSVAKAFGYSLEELSDIPQDANLGLSCGNPLATATLREGETVIDLGSGAGFDVFLAANKVGPEGKVIGVDMNEEMLRKAEELKVSSGKQNVEFVKSQITRIALEDSIADCIISNCVINLVPEEEKQLVFHEMFRLLKPGGRVAISDILAKGPLPEDLRKSMALYVGCIAGASQVGMYQKYLKEAGFHGIVIQDTGNDLNVYRSAAVDNSGQDPSDGTQDKCCCAKSSTQDGFIMKDVDYNEWTASYNIFAVKQ
ncbi:ubiE/COQ5 methyltransferase [Trichoderma reesei RUT C-30]|uniref:Arsenite methyltransferase n=1 Tax=Hypocrea jecorina (strain ATCC 56765 / BCRC 32924 / NRRL 11460 / Rut C-30) TaxID=1344414 RepID=A0A024RZM1_HYPJR|nr:ubiE/COQ5 methyltransferase [Trichoderma reesei RUT C-30]